MSFQFPSQAQTGARPSAAIATGYLSQAFLWMFAGLILTAGVAFVVQRNEAVLGAVAGAWLPILIGQLALAWGISLGIGRMNATLALGLFFVYAATLGFTIGMIVSIYDGPSVATAFLSASAMFGAAGVYGVVTKRALAGLGGFLAMGVIGLLVAMLVNLVFPSGALGVFVRSTGETPVTVTFSDLAIYEVDYTLPTKTPIPTP